MFAILLRERLKEKEENRYNQWEGTAVNQNCVVVSTDISPFHLTISLPNDLPFGCMRLMSENAYPNMHDVDAPVLSE